MNTPGSVRWRLEVWGPPCPNELMVAITWCGARLQVHSRAVPAFVALARVFAAHAYTVRRRDTGAYNCRVIKGTETASSHSWGISLDVNWETNPWLPKLITDIPNELVQDIYRIKTAGGKQVWRWGGDWDGRPDTKHGKYDAMHFEIIVGPDELTRPLLVPAPVFPIIKEGAHGHYVNYLQRLVGIGETGYFGPVTTLRVKDKQKRFSLVEDGVVGPKTWRELTR